MLNLLEQYFEEHNIFNGEIPKYIEILTDTVNAKSIPYRMKTVMAVSELMLFISQFHRNIKHWTNVEIPINSIAFCIAKSGAAKDSSAKTIRRCFTKGYDIINSIREDRAVKRAIQAAVDADKMNASNWNVYRHYYTQPNPLFLAISTQEGFTQHLNALEMDKLGAGYIYSGEIGTELQSSQYIVDNIKLLSELYDEGTKELKAIKEKEKQQKEVKNLPVSAMFIGSQDNLLYDDQIKRKFRSEFNTKLARRSFFCFAYEQPEKDSFNTIDEFLKAEKAIKDIAAAKKEKIEDYIEDIAKWLAETAGEPITVSKEVEDLFTIYKRYNEEIAETMEVCYSMAKLTRMHMQWKALKVSGAFALFDGNDEITLDNYIDAINFVELISNDILIFEKELAKEPYETFATYVKDNNINGEITVSLHELRKHGFINNKGAPSTKIKELRDLVESYDNSGEYTCDEKTISYKQFNETDKILLSYVEVDTNVSKQQKAYQAVRGFQCEELKFTDLPNMLKGDYAYTPFMFAGGVRNNENICSPCKWVVIDVDKSSITDIQAHMMLSDINHIIVRTSQADNPYKFRLLIEFDIQVNVDNAQWITFIQLLGKELGVVPDQLAKSHIVYSYSGREILTNFVDNPYSVKHLIVELARLKKKKKEVKLTDVERSDLLDNPIDTFQSAFYAKEGEGVRKMLWAARYAIELGADKDYVYQLMTEINEYWIHGLSSQELRTRVLNTVDRILNGTGR